MLLGSLPKLRYLDGLMWRATVKDAGGLTASVKATPNQGKPFYKTKYGNRFNRVKGKFLTLRLESGVLFTLSAVGKNKESNKEQV